MFTAKDIEIKPDAPKELLLDKHEKYLKQYANDDSSVDQILGEYLKMSGMYWGLNALCLIKALDEESPEVIRALEFVKKCQKDDGGFGAHPDHDSHILHTLSAVQILVILGKCNADYIDIDRCANYVKSLQQDDGSFFGDKWGEIDARLSFCALATMKLINKLNMIDLDKAVEFILRCHNQPDGGFGGLPGMESHSAYVFCCVGSLAIADKLDRIDQDTLGWWLSMRQLPSGGLNGRPEKLPDLCYSWWCLSSMKMINKMHLIDHKRLIRFILACQDEEHGGFSDRPGNYVDPFHTVFGLAGLSLIYYHFEENGLDKEDKELKDLLDMLKDNIRPVEPTLCLPLK